MEHSLFFFFFLTRNRNKAKRTQSTLYCCTVTLMKKGWTLRTCISEETARLTAPFKCLSAPCYHETMCGISVISTMLLGRGQEVWAFGCHPIISFIRCHQSYRLHLPLFYLFILWRIHLFFFLQHVVYLSPSFTVDISWYRVAALLIPAGPAYLKGWLDNSECVHEHAWARTLSFRSSRSIYPSISFHPHKIESRNKWRLHNSAAASAFAAEQK